MSSFSKGGMSCLQKLNDSLKLTLLAKSVPAGTLPPVPVGVSALAKAQGQAFQSRLHRTERPLQLQGQLYRGAA